MNSDTSGREDAELNTNNRLKPSDVPVFNCIVYICPDSGGGVRARVANLPGLECKAASERDALSKIVPAFKQRVGELMRSNTPIPWIEPPASAESDEATRHIPVHL